MLDDLKFIHERDAQDALGIAEKQGTQLEERFELSPESKTISNIVLAGMGGSALGAQIALSWPGFSMPFTIVRDYTLPDYVGPQTLFFASSYSGNTEETLSALAEAEEKRAVIVVIASGGKLAEQAEAKGYPLLRLPSGYQPRHAVLYSLKALLVATDAYGITKGAAEQLASKRSFVEECVKQWRPDVAAAQNQAKQIAQELMGKSVVVYGGPKMYPAAYKWKISFNENAKHIAWVNQYPEFNHNEFLGWTKQPVDKPYAVIDLRSNLEHERVQKRFIVTERLLSGMRPAPIVVEAQGSDILEQLLSTIALGDFVSLYLALLNNLNPTPVELIERFKAELNK